MDFKNIGSSDGRQQPPAAMPLARQSSVYSLTFDEFQNTLGGGIGKDFGSMNMDELLKNIWTAEETQAIASSVGGGGAAAAGASGLQRQGSLTLSRTISQKTVDEVWRDFVPAGDGFHPQQQRQRQPTLGEMTLEEFLVRAGVVREDINQPPPAPLPDPGPILATPRNNGGSVFYNDIGAVPHNQISSSATANLAIMTGGPARPYPSPLPLRNAGDLVSMQGMRGGGIMGIGGDAPMNNGLLHGVVGLGRGGGGGGGVTIAAAPPMVSAVNTIFSDGLVKSSGDLSPISPMPYVFGGGMRGRKRSGAVEKVVERRQRRMIKNRESAARSRARKQAYTMELEAEIAKLKVQNEELQNKQEEILEMQKNQVLEIISQQQQRPKKQCLKRTQTGPW